MQCQQCGSELRAGAEFCSSCGAKTSNGGTALCQQCGAPVGENVKFCRQCGNPIGANQEAIAKPVFCATCGSEIKPGSTFCVACGSNLKAEPMPQYKQQVQEPNPPVHEPTFYAAEPKKTNRGLIAIIIILTVLILAVGCFLAYIFINENTPNSESETAVKTEQPENIKKPEDGEKEEAFESPEPTPTPTPTPTPSPTPVPLYESSTEFFPSNSRYITDADLNGKSQDEVAFIRNEIYARHGYIFKTEPFKSYFEAQSWYAPNPYFDESMFNSIEYANKEFIAKYEIARGWR